MDSDVIETVTDWETTPVADGYAGLRELVDRGFSGAVTDGTAWLFVLNGRVVGVFDGSVEDFDGADATAHAAPDPALPLLFAMRERGGETRARYYSNDTPLSAADETLSENGFTGYVELSENVLSGDYYVVYYGGRSMSAAFVGSSRQLLTGDEAFDRADEEVGIYEVRSVDVEVTDIPEPAGDEEASGDAADPDPAGVAVADAETGTDPDAAESDAPTEPEPATAPEEAATPEADRESEAERPVDAERSPDAGAEESANPNGTAGAADGADAAGAAGAADAGDDAEPAGTPPSAGASADSQPPDAGSSDGEPSAPSPQSTSESNDSPESADAPESNDAPESAAASTSSADDDVFSEEAQWRETRSIPSLDPARSMDPPQGSRPQWTGSSQTGTQSAGATTQPTAEGASRAGDESPGQPDTGGVGGATSPSEAPAADATDAAGQSAAAGDAGAAQSSRTAPPEPADASVSDRSSVAANQLQRRLQRVERDLERVERERDALAEERDEARETAERLRERVAELEAELEELRTARAEAGAAADAERSLDPAGALGGTNLFVRYDSKGAATLEEAHAGEADREQVGENLRLEHHTEFDADDVAVDGRPFAAFLEDSVEYGFVRWVVEELLYEVRDTGAGGALGGLYDAVPRIDRAEFDGAVEVGEEEGEGETRRFDVVLRDRMGTPLLVANLNDSREPATDGMMETLIEDASLVGDAVDDLGAAFLVTASYFDPAALETASEATGGGLLRREKRKSFVKLSRKRGYHLCLVETRNGEFHVNVPEL